MALPTYDQFIEPLFRYLGAHSEGVLTTEAYEAMADALELTPDQRQELLPSGSQAVYKNRIGWANDRLKRQRYSESLVGASGDSPQLGRNSSRPTPTRSLRTSTSN